VIWSCDCGIVAAWIKGKSSEAFLITAGNSFIKGSATCKTDVPAHICLSQISMLTKARWESHGWCDVPLRGTAPLLSAEFVSQWELLLLRNISLRMLQLSCKIF